MAPESAPVWTGLPQALAGTASDWVWAATASSTGSAGMAQESALVSMELPTEWAVKALELGSAGTASPRGESQAGKAPQTNPPADRTV
jgi:hypothetical protein